MPGDAGRIPDVHHLHYVDALIDASGQPAEILTQETLDEALANLDFPEPVINNFVTNIAQNETFITELISNETYITELTSNEWFVTEITEVLVTNNTFVTELTENTTFIQETVNQITEVQESNTYITQITENNTFIDNTTTIINANINGKKGLPGELATLAADSQLTHTQIPTELKQSAFEIQVDGGGSVITAGIKARFKAPWACTITGWELGADIAGSIVFDIWKDTYANYPPTVGNSIAGSEKPTLSSVIKNQDTSLNSGAGWAVNAGDWIFVNADATPSTVTFVALYLSYTRTI